MIAPQSQMLEESILAIREALDAIVATASALPVSLPAGIRDDIMGDALRRVIAAGTALGLERAALPEGAEETAPKGRGGRGRATADPLAVGGTLSARLAGE